MADLNELEQDRFCIQMSRKATIRASIVSPEAELVRSIRNSYFIQKDIVTEISMVISKAFQTNFTHVEQVKATTKMVGTQFNAQLQKVKDLVQQYEQEFLIKTSELGAISPLVKAYTLRSSLVSKKQEGAASYLDMDYNDLNSQIAEAESKDEEDLFLSETIARQSEESKY